MGSWMKVSFQLTLFLCCVFQNKLKLQTFFKLLKIIYTQWTWGFRAPGEVWGGHLVLHPVWHTSLWCMDRRCQAAVTLGFWIFISILKKISHYFAIKYLPWTELNSHILNVFHTFNLMSHKGKIHLYIPYNSLNQGNNLQMAVIAGMVLSTCLSSFYAKTASLINTLSFRNFKSDLVSFVTYPSFRWSWNEGIGLTLQGCLCVFQISIF